MSEVPQMATQCTVNGVTGSFLYTGDSASLNFRFVGPFDNQKLASPIFSDSLELYQWARVNGNPEIGGLRGNYRIWNDE